MEDEIFKIMLSNSVTLHKEKPYCYKCSIPIENWNDALLHVLSKEHVSLIQSYKCLWCPKLVNFSPMKCKRWVNNGIVINTIKEMKCMLCSCTLSTLDDSDHIEQHITGKHHTSSLSVSKVIHACRLNSENSGKSNREILLENKLTPTLSPYFICTACLCTLSSLPDVVEHIKAKRHIKKLQTVDFQWNMVNAETIKHDANHNFIGDNTLSEVETQQEKDTINSYSKHGIVRGKAERFNCNICLRSRMLLETALKHIEDSHHLTALKNLMSIERMKVSATTETFCSSIETKCPNDGVKKNARTQWFQKQGIIVGDYNTVICTVCFRALPSLSHDVQHLEGRRHNNAAKAVRTADILPVLNLDTNLEKDTLNSELTRKTLESDVSSYETTQQIIEHIYHLISIISSNLSHSSTINHNVSSQNTKDESTTGTNSQHRNTSDLRMIVPNCYNHSSSDEEKHSLNETYSSSKYMVGVRCLCCKVILYSQESVKDHFSKKEHEGNIQRMLQSIGKSHFGGTKYSALTQANTFKEYETFSLCNLIMLDEEITFLTIKVRWKNITDTSINNGITGVLLTCNICHIKLESPCNLIEHFSSRKAVENGPKKGLIKTPRRPKREENLLPAFNRLSISDKKPKKDRLEPFVIPLNICLLTLSDIKEKPTKYKPSDTNRDNIGLEPRYTEEFLNVEEKMYSFDILNHGCIITAGARSYCLICERKTTNDKEQLIHHICYCNRKKQSSSVTLFSELTKEAEKSRIELILQLQKYMDKWYWYSINRFCCLVCCSSFMNKSKFIYHVLDSHRHLWRSNKLIFEGCMACSTLWLSITRVLNEHISHQMHLYLKESKLFYVETLPAPAVELFQDIQVVIDELYELSENILVSNTQTRLKTSLEAFLKNSRGSLTRNVKVRFFGPRSIGLTVSESNVYIVSDTVEGEDIDNIKENEIEEWYVNVDNPAVTVICHKETHLVCNICQIGDTEIRKSEILRVFCKQYEPCRRLILFLKKWLSCCSLPGRYNLSDEALTWLVVFSLQANSHLPSVVLHQAGKSECQEATANPIEPQTIHYLLVEFFTFYADFDYRRYVISPFMGYKIKRECFTQINKLPKEMHHYYKENCRIFYLDVGNSLYLQDPVDLYVNLTKNVESVTLKHFREYCKKSMMMLSETKT